MKKTVNSYPNGMNNFSNCDDDDEEEEEDS